MDVPKILEQKYSAKDQITAYLISKLTDNGYEVRMNGDSCIASRSEKHEYIVFEGVKIAIRSICLN